jgi:hypothetical protein
MADNIAMTPADESRVEEILDETPAETPKEETSKEETVNTTVLYTLFQADQVVLSHYERTKGKVEHRFPLQLIDGSVVEFVDPTLNVTLAAGRLRFGNQLMVDNNTGALTAPVYISNINFKKDILTINVQ